MELRELGCSGLKVSAIGLGCFAMTDAYGASDEGEALATLGRALDLGVTLFDTAELYGPYANETLVGRGLKGRRDQAVIATKFGWLIEDGAAVGVDSRPERIRAAVEGSLKRLGVDHIDLLYQHRVDPGVPIEDVAGAVGELVKAGKVRFLGLSEAGADTLRRAHAVHPVAALQSEYSLWERGLETDILPLLRELGIGLVPFAPLGRGFLAGSGQKAESYAASDFRKDDPRFQGANFEANLRAAAIVGEIAAQRDATPAQVALAWLLHQGHDIVPIPGTRRRTHLEQNVAATALRLSPDDVLQLEQGLSAVSGSRYSDARMTFVQR
ncbi:aldo/keto reductase [Caulobacter sp. S45]|uniref:aldo/keto reductase n=1 Tax=Caulobacter sp. S45 TaxID=1641861 RepID=UPI00131E0781|nr:aldo/keto reductase [Caulobacter sp. S45]